MSNSLFTCLSLHNYLAKQLIADGEQSHNITK
ncbi:hypothetical protein C7434_1985 [Pantoea sp. PNA 14-12]|nr:hypothetical protein C7433_103234 [Pantoea sp. PNA 03-3]TDS70107.1 hypothetical protein C7434_1985 [Pantoea sp. PNA 14-12]